MRSLKSLKLEMLHRDKLLLSSIKICYLYDYISKTCQSFYDPDKETWLPRNEKFIGVKFHTAKLASHKRIENFVNALNISDVYHIPGHVGRWGYSQV